MTASPHEKEGIGLLSMESEFYAQAAGDPMQIKPILIVLLCISVVAFVANLMLTLDKQSRRIDQQSVEIRRVQNSIPHEIVHFTGNEPMYYSWQSQPLNTSNWNEGDWNRYNLRMKQEREGVSQTMQPQTIDQFKARHPELHH